MVVINSTRQQSSGQASGPHISPANSHHERVCDCSLMAGAINRHNEDAVVIIQSLETEALTREMERIINGAEQLPGYLTQNEVLTPLESHELRMVWNKLRYLITTTFGKIALLLNGSAFLWIFLVALLLVARATVAMALYSLFTTLQQRFQFMGQVAN